MTNKKNRLSKIEAKQPRAESKVFVRWDTDKPLPSSLKQNTQIITVVWE